MQKKVLAIIFILTFMFIHTGFSYANPEFKLIYVIQEGDTLSDIAQKYDVTVDSILTINNISKEKWIKVGQELVIPKTGNYQKNTENKKQKWNYNLFNSKNKNVSLDVGNTYSIRINPKQPLPTVSIPESQILTYHVGVGDTLFDLSRSFNTSIGVIMALNNMDNSIIRVGDNIRLPINNLTPRQVLAKVIKPTDVDLLARAIFGEARGEPFMGQVAVGAVIINRVLSSYFPDTFRKVIFQPGQFSAVDDGQINLSPNRKAYRAARAAIKGQDPTLGSLYYYNPKIAKNKWWFAKRKLVVTIGDHVFAK